MTNEAILQNNGFLNMAYKVLITGTGRVSWLFTPLALLGHRLSCGHRRYLVCWPWTEHAPWFSLLCPHLDGKNHHWLQAEAAWISPWTSHSIKAAAFCPPDIPAALRGHLGSQDHELCQQVQHRHFGVKGHNGQHTLSPHPIPCR